MRKVPIKLHTANALRWLGSLYRNPADAIKEHVSNAIDEHLKAKGIGKELPICGVTFTLEKDKVIIDYPYGMSKEEFEDALKRVADSVKKSLDFRQIGQLGIGMFSFLQIGKRCIFFSKKDKGYETIKVTLREGSDEAEFETALRKESLSSPGIKIIISGLLFDPTKPRGPLSPEKLQKLFAEKFNPYLKDKSLEIIIYSKGNSYIIKPLKIDLPRIGESYKNWPLTRDRSKTFSLELYFDPSGKGIVKIRHMGVAIVDDIKTLSAYGLEESIYANGDVKGFIIDVDFLKPLPARTGFEENEDWINLLDELDKLRPSIEAEVEIFKQEEAKKKLTEIQRKAIELAREILNTEEFKDLELLEGLGRKPPEPRLPPNGFDFVPSSIRVEPGKTGVLQLKAFVPKVVPDNSMVQLSINDSSVELKTYSLLLKASEADKDGVVTAHVSFVGKLKTMIPAILTAIAGSLKAKAHIRVAESGPTREPKSPGEKGEGPRINYQEIPFEEGPLKHSRYVSRIIQINTLNSDYKQETTGSQDAILAYTVLMIGKETIAYNDKTGATDEYLEKILSFYFRLKSRLTGASLSIMKKLRGRSKKSI